MDETIEVLTERVKKHIKEASDYQTEADNATLAASKTLQANGASRSLSPPSVL